MAKHIFLLLVFCIVSQVTVAQWTYTLTISGNGTQKYGPYPTKAECERNRLLDISANNWSHYLDLGNGRGGTIKVSATATPCTGPAGSSIGNVDILGVGKGNSFYSTNSVNEINDWSEDEARRRMGLDANQVVEEVQIAPITDSNYKSALIELNGKTYFRSLNIDEQGRMLNSSSDLDMFEPLWQTEKKRRNLPDADVFEYKDRILSESMSLIDKILSENNITREQLETISWERGMWIDDYFMKEKKSLEAERDVLEKVLLLAHFKVDYKAKLINEDNISLQGAESLMDMTNGLASLTGVESAEQYEKRDLASKEQFLLEKGISYEDIQKVKTETEKESLMKKHIGEDINGDTHLPDSPPYINSLQQEQKNNVDMKLANILESAGAGVEIGVIVNNIIEIENYKTEATAIGNLLKRTNSHLESIEKEYKEQKEVLQSIQDLLNATTSDTTAKVNEMNRNEMLNWASSTNQAIEKTRLFSNTPIGTLGREHITILQSKY